MQITATVLFLLINLIVSWALSKAAKQGRRFYVIFVLGPFAIIMLFVILYEWVLVMGVIHRMEVEMGFW